MKDDKTRSTDIKVGIFVTLGVATLMLVVFVIGQERHFFERPVFLKAFFSNVAGLKVGAPVRLAGVDVGIVSRIDFPGIVPEAPTMVAGSVDVGSDRYRGVAPDLDLVGGAGTVKGWRLPLQKEELRFDDPTPMSVAAIAKAPEGQGDGRLSAQVLFVGTDQWGAPLRQTIDVAVIKGTTARTVGDVKFSTVTDAVLRYVADAEAGEQLLVGIDPTREIQATLRVHGDSLERIRKGSVAKVDSMGLLGDKTIDISMGPAGNPRHEDGHTIEAKPVGDLFADLEKGISEIKGAFAGVRDVLGSFLEGGGEAKVNELLDIVNALGEEVQHGEGLVHQLIYDDTSANKYKIKEVIAQLNVATSKVNGTLADIDKMVEEVKTGDGVIHAAVYGEGGKETISEAQKTLAQARQILEDVRTKEGIVHQLIYKEDNGATIANVTAATDNLKVASDDLKTTTADVKEIVAEVKRGEGTLGALIKDPSVYEDVKVLLGNVKRNDAVKALVRYAIEREDQIASPKKAAPTK
jgi:phospholipid/cholesterol/gamma-HCH transport system substrate-binding protein